MAQQMPDPIELYEAAAKGGSAGLSRGSRQTR